MSKTSAENNQLGISPDDIRHDMRVVARSIRYLGNHFWSLT
ncbi:MAG: hypothetical protein ABJN22_12205 [Litorimonas sp.]